MSGPDDNELLRAALRAKEMMDKDRAAITRLAGIRRDAVRELRAGGMGVTEIARRVGVSRQQVYRIMRGRA